MKKIKDIKVRLYSFLKTIKYTFSVSFKSSKKYFMANMITITVLPIITLINSLLIKTIFDNIATGKVDCSHMLYLIIALATVSVLFICINNMQPYILNMFSETIDNYLRTSLMDATLLSEIELFDNSKKFDQLAFANSNIGTITSFVWSSISFFGALFSLFINFLFLFLYLPYGAICLIFVSLPSAIIVTVYTKKAYELAKAQIPMVREREYLYNISTEKEFSQDIRLNHTQTYFAAKYKSLWDIIFSQRKQQNFKRTILSTVFQIFPEVISIGLLVIIIKQILSGYRTIGDLSYLSNLTSQIIVSMGLLIQTVIRLYDNRMRIESIQNFFASTLTQRTFNKHTINEIESVEFNNVTFKYPNSQNFVLKNLTFRIDKDEKVALVGVNGAGKSTVLKLILGFYKPCEGEIYINGVDLKTLSEQSLHSLTSAYFQNSSIYAFTVRENFQLTNCNVLHNDESIIESLCKAGLANDFEDYSSNLDTFVSKRFDPDGWVFSVGQQQKFALGKCIHKQCQLFLLDEPTSSLDAKSGFDFFNALSEFCKHKTVVYTCHNFSTIGLATRIIVIEDGMIVEDGVPHELFLSNSKFRELLKYQTDPLANFLEQT